MHCRGSADTRFSITSGRDSAARKRAIPKRRPWIRTVNPKFPCKIRKRPLCRPGSEAHPSHRHAKIRHDFDSTLAKEQPRGGSSAGPPITGRLRKITPKRPSWPCLARSALTKERCGSSARIGGAELDPGGQPKFVRPISVGSRRPHRLRLGRGAVDLRAGRRAQSGRSPPGTAGSGSRSLLDTSAGGIPEDQHAAALPIDAGHQRFRNPVQRKDSDRFSQT